MFLEHAARVGRALSRTAAVESLESRRLLSTATLLRDINPAGDAEVSAAPLVVGGIAYLAANDGVHGRELWKTDGTEAGTVLVKDVRPGPESSNVNTIVAAGGIVYFIADDGQSGPELWRTDGAEAGTTLVKDINPGPAHGIFYDFPSSFADLNNLLFFVANDGVHGDELWRSDGSEAGTFMVADLTPGPVGSLPGEFQTMAGLLFFTARGSHGGSALWRSDGTTDGTFQIQPEGAGDPPSVDTLVRAGTKLFFTAEKTLWVSDGTAAGTRRVTRRLPQGLNGSVSAPVAAASGFVYFYSSGGRHDTSLWRSDGTDRGTVRIKDVSSGITRSTATLGDTVFFTDSGIDNSSGAPTAVEVLWKSDGTPRGTTPLGVADERVFGLSALAGRMYVSASKSNGQAAQLWEAGAAGGARRVDLAAASGAAG